MKCDWYAASFWILGSLLTPISRDCHRSARFRTLQAPPLCESGQSDLCQAMLWLRLTFRSSIPTTSETQTELQTSNVFFMVIRYSFVFNFETNVRVFTSKCFDILHMPQPRHLQLTWSQICGPGVQSCIDASHILPASAAKSNKVTIHDNSIPHRQFKNSLHPCTSPIAHHAFPKVCLH